MNISKGATLIHRLDEVFETELYARLIQLRLRFHTPYYFVKHGQIALIHLPKTAGTSLHTLLNDDKLHRFINLNAHRPVSKFCKPGKYEYITVMRNPIDRVWSHYCMILSTPHARFLHVANKGIENYLKHCWMGRNMACRYYAGNVASEPNEQTLALARENLSRFLCVLSFDHIEEDLTRFLREYDIPAATIPHKRKVSYAQPTPDERDLIASYNRYDMDLFNDFQATQPKTR